MISLEQGFRPITDADIEAWQADKSRLDGKSNRLVGKRIVVTGKLEKYTRAEIENVIENHGGSYCTEVRYGVSFVLTGNIRNGKFQGGKMSRKLKAAQEYNINIIDEWDFEQMIAEGAL